MEWVKLLRRAAAVFAATLALWALSLTTDLTKVLGETVFPRAGATYSMGDERTFWEKLLLRQSPFLQVGQALSAVDSRTEDVEAVPSLPPSPEPAPAPQPAPQVSEDDTPLPAAHQSQNVIARTLLPAKDGSYLSAGGVFLFNRTSQTVDMAALAQQPIELTGSGAGPRILIIHTHATEAYTQEGADVYEESDPYRTTDDAHNVVRVGDEMAAAFAQAGLNVLHDRTLYDYPNYNGAYTRSRAAVEEYLSAFPSISVVLDVHRDALAGENDVVYKVMADSETCPDTAQVMLVAGTQEGGSSHLEWRKNLTFAMRLERELNEKAPTLARPIVLRKSHYNQDLSPGSLLVEVGTHGNTLQEAIAAARAFASLSAPVLREILP